MFFRHLVASIISLTLILRSSSTIWWILAMLWLVVAVFGRPNRSLSPKLLRPYLNSNAQNCAGGKWCCRVPIYRVQPIFDLRRRIIFQRDRSILDFFHFHKNIYSHGLVQVTVRSRSLKLWLIPLERCTFPDLYWRVLPSTRRGRKLSRPPSHTKRKNAFIVFEKLGILYKIKKNMGN